MRGSRKQLHDALHLTNEKHRCECCAAFADLGDPESPELAPDDDDVGMSIEELEKLLAEGV